MLKDTLKRNEAAAANADALAVLRENFAGCFTKEGAFDLKAFAAQIRDKVAVTEEGYQLDFLGKNYARLLANEETETVIVPDEAHNAKPENAKSQNVYISGDNLDALKHLLKSYEHEVKCIYIDPPYNTGSDGFVYNDNFKFKPDELARKLSITEEEAKKLLDFVGRGSASHSAWLMFMYPRLQLAKSLLRDDGVIFISIDDNEQANLKLLCDDVFGEQNLVAQITTLCNPKGRSQDMYIANCHEYLLAYSRKVLTKGAMSIDKTGSQILADYPLEDVQGLYRELELRNTHREFGKHNRPNMFYPFYVNDSGDVSLEQSDEYSTEVLPMWEDGFEGCWTWDKKKAAKELDLLVAHKSDEKWTMYRKSYAIQDGEVAQSQLKSIWLSKKIATERGQEVVNELFGADEKIFQGPKSPWLIGNILDMAHVGENDIIVDFFSGSGTTAHAVYMKNAYSKAAKKRKFILIQWEELIPDDKPAYKMGFRKIDEIGRERIQKAADKIAKENPSLAHSIDLGFKHFTLAKPSGEVLEKIEAFDPKASLLATQDMLKEFGVGTVLATWLNHDGYGLTREAEKVDLVGYEAYLCGHHLYLVNANFGAKNVKALLEKYETDKAFTPDKIVLFGYSFGWKELEELDTNLKKLKTTRNITADLDIRY